jgi:hypothetical protein
MSHLFLRFLQMRCQTGANFKTAKTSNLIAVHFQLNFTVNVEFNGHEFPNHPISLTFNAGKISGLHLE